MKAAMNTRWQEFKNRVGGPLRRTVMITVLAVAFIIVVIEFIIIMNAEKFFTGEMVLPQIFGLHGM